MRLRRRARCGHRLVDDGAAQTSIVGVEHDVLAGRDGTLGGIENYMQRPVIQPDDLAGLVCLAVPDLGGTSQGRVNAGGRCADPGAAGSSQLLRVEQGAVSLVNDQGIVIQSLCHDVPRSVTGLPQPTDAQSLPMKQIPVLSFLA